MLTRLGHEAAKSTNSLITLSHRVAERVRSDCPEVAWKASYVILGPADYVDVFEAPDIETALKVAGIVRSFGHASTEIWAATKWDDFVAAIERQGSGARRAQTQAR
jgi:uncharacterized protein with GYD domain